MVTNLVASMKNDLIIPLALISLSEQDRRSHRFLLTLKLYDLGIFEKILKVILIRNYILDRGVVILSLHSQTNPWPTQPNCCSKTLCTH